MPFRLEHITLADRVELGCACLLVAGQYGAMTELAAALGTSRQFLYTLRARARAGLEAGLAPGCIGYAAHPPHEHRQGATIGTGAMNGRIRWRAGPVLAGLLIRGCPRAI